MVDHMVGHNLVAGNNHSYIDFVDLEAQHSCRTLVVGYHSCIDKILVGLTLDHNLDFLHSQPCLQLKGSKTAVLDTISHRLDERQFRTLTA